MTEEEIDRLAELINVQVKENSVVIFRCPKKDVKSLADSLDCIERSGWNRLNIFALACPDYIEVIVVPSGSKVVVKALEGEMTNE